MIKLDPATGNIIDTDDTATFRTYLEPVFDTTDLVGLYEKMSEKILESFATYLKNGSGWVLKRVIHAEITTCQLRPLRGSFGINKKYKTKEGYYEHEERRRVLF